MSLASTAYNSVKTLGSQDDLATRFTRAKEGDLTEGGAVDPREAADFVVGYVDVRWIPGALADGELTSARKAKLETLLAPWRKIEEITDATEAYQAAMVIGAKAASMPTIKDGIGKIFAPIIDADKDREPAVRTLEHAATWFAAGGFPSISETFVLAADTSAHTEGLFAAFGKAVETVVAKLPEPLKAAVAASSEFGADAIDELKKLPDAASQAGAVLLEKAQDAGQDLKEAVGDELDEVKKKVAGGLNVLQETGKAIEKGLTDSLGDAKTALGDMKDAGLGEIQARYEQLQALGEEVKSAAGEKKAELLGMLTAASASFEAQVERLKAAGTATQQMLIDKFQGALDQAKRYGDQAKELALALPAMIEQAIVEKVGDPRKMIADLKAQYETMKSDPCQFVGGGAASAVCRMATGTGKGAGMGALPWLLLGIPLALLVIWLAVKGAGATKAVAGLKFLVA